MREVPGFPGYYVAARGEVYSSRRGSLKRRVTTLNSSGYPSLSLCLDGKMFTRSVHRLVAMAYLDTWDSSLVVNHKDGVKTNNNVENLEMCTSKENSKHAYINGLVPVRKGQDINTNKLHPNQVVCIRYLYQVGIRPKELSDFYGVTVRTIWDIIYYISWKHIRST